MADPTALELLNILVTQTGLPRATLVGILKVPLYPAGLRDELAMRAGEADISEALEDMPRVERVLDGPAGRKTVTRGLPDDHRALARYAHADAMLRARMLGVQL